MEYTEYAKREIERERARWYHFHKYAWTKEPQFEPHEKNARGETADELFIRVMSGALNRHRFTKQKSVAYWVAKMIAAKDDTDLLEAAVQGLMDKRESETLIKKAQRHAKRKTTATDRTCQECDAIIPAMTHRRQKFCSPRCRVAAHRKEANKC
ncbi:hypothetical protein [Falsihalocynthiibacter sp. CO-5D18]|uniref:hypothetical protein n=1 Tax=Falsihalocynthiibacter sp. CO-5D18 TaxID=3240872 RepID=UPI00350FBFDB